MESESFIEKYQRELRRLGLDEDSSPYGVMAGDSEEATSQFLAHLSALPVGATWRDVFPDIPNHWDLADEETWTHRFHPLGPYDYQSLPCGPAVLLRLPLGSTDADLEQLSADASSHGLNVYGSGFVPIENPNWPDRLAYVVLNVATTEAEYYEFVDLVQQHPGVEIGGYSRPVGTQFAPEEGT